MGLRLSDLKPGSYTVSEDKPQESNKSVLKLSDLKPGSYSVAPEEQSLVSYAKESAINTGKAALVGFKDWAPFGESIQAKGEQVVFSLKDDPDKFYDYVKKRKENEAQLQAENPLGYTIGSGFGLFGTGKLPVPGTKAIGSAAEKVGEYGSKLNPYIGRFGEGATKAVGRTMQQASIGALEGGTSNPFQLFDAERAIQQGGTTAVLQGGIELGSAGYELAKILARPVGTKVGYVVGGVRPEVQKEYIDRQKDLKDYSLGEVPNRKADLGGRIKNATGDLQKNADEAKLAMYATKEQLTEARRAVTDDMNEYFTNLKTKSLPENIAPQLDEAMKSARKEVSSGSSEAFDLLGDTPVKMSGLKKSLTTKINSLQVAKQPPLPGSSDEALFNRLKSIRDALDNYPQVIKASEAKVLVQQVDSIIESMYDRGMAAYNPKAARGLVEFRGYIDSVLKENGKYSEKMAEVSAKTKALQNVTEYFGSGNTQDTLVKLSNPKSGEAIVARKNLGDFDNTFKTNFSQQIEDFVESKKLLSDPRHKKDVEALFEKKYGVPTIVDTLNRNKENFGEASDKFKKVGYVAIPESKISDLQRGSGQKRNAEEFFQNLEENTGQKFSQEAKDLALLEKFNQSNQAGSRNVQAWRTILERIPVLGPVTGLVLDKYGPAMTKGVIDIAVSSKPAMDRLVSIARDKNLSSAVVQKFLNDDPEFSRVVNPNKFQRVINQRSQ